VDANLEELKGTKVMEWKPSSDAFLINIHGKTELRTLQRQISSYVFNMEHKHMDAACMEF
jgi:hypothetical protein